MALIRLNAMDPNDTNDYLRTLTGKSVGQPPVLDSLNRLGQVAQGIFTYVSVNVSKALGFAFGTASGSVGRRVMTFDYAATANQQDPQDNGIDSWTYGAGYRIGILTFDAEATAQIGLAALAAKATLERKEIQIQVLRYGIPRGPAIPVPNFAKFDVAAYGLFMQWQKEVINYMKKHRAQLSPIRIYASLSIDIEQYFNSTAPLRYALHRLLYKDTLAKALNMARQKQIPHVVGHEAVVRAVYAEVTGYGDYLNEERPIDDHKISDTARRSAEDWIQQFHRL